MLARIASRVHHAPVGRKAATASSVWTRCRRTQARILVARAVCQCARPAAVPAPSASQPETQPGTATPDTMRAVILPEPHPGKRAEDVLVPVTDAPVPLPGVGQVRVRVHATGVCHRDVLDRRGAFPFINKPSVLGHEIAGVVDAVGTGVPESRLGEKVVSLHWAPCGTCRPCSRGDSTVCSNARDSFFGLTTNGGYAQYTVNGASAFVPVPDGWRAIEAAPVQCTHGTVWHAAIVKGKLRGGESVVVSGASGGVGSAAVQIFSALGARVIALTSNAAKIEYLHFLGAHDVVVVGGETPVHKSDVIRKLGGVDMAFEAVGEPMFGTSLRCLRPGGRLVLIGNVTNAQAKLPLGLMIINSLQVIGSDSITAGELADVFDFMSLKGIRPRVSQVLALEDAAKAHQLLEDKAVTGRVVLDVGGEW